MKKVIIVIVGILILIVGVIGGVIYVNRKTEEKKYLEEYEMIQKVTVEYIKENYPSTKEIEFSPVFVDRTTLGVVNVRYTIKITNIKGEKLESNLIYRNQIFYYTNDTQEKIEKEIVRLVDSTFRSKDFGDKIERYNSAPKYDEQITIKYDNKIKEW